MNAPVQPPVPSLDLTTLLQTLNAHTLLLRVLVSLAEFGVPDRLLSGPKTASELAAGARLDAPTLYRVLRYAASHGIVVEDGGGRFSLAAGAEGLCAEAAHSVRSRLRRPWQDLVWKSYERLPDMLRSGTAAFDLAFGESFFDYLAAHPEQNALFDQSMARLSQVENPLIAASFPFGDYDWIVDIGGGHGGLLAAVLDRYPAIRAVLFDQPQVLAAGDALFEGRHRDRAEPAAGDFFAGVPPGGDIYILKRILHDWDDDRAQQILEHCRTALRPTARLLVIDAVMKPGNEPDPNKFMDVNIMALTGGRERTESEFRDLCARAGLKLLGLRPLPSPAALSLLEVGLA